MKKIMGIVLASILAFSVVGCSDANNKSSDATNKKEEVIKNHKIGESINLDKDKNVMVSVTNIREVEKDILGRDVNNTYAVEIEIVNNSNNDIESDFMSNYIVKDNENRECEQVLNQISPQLMYDTIHPGDTLKGEIAWETKEGATPKTIEIDLGLEYYTVFDLN